jgi:hypothetical protein
MSFKSSALVRLGFSKIFFVLYLLTIGGPAKAAPVMLIDSIVSATPDGNQQLGFTSKSVAIFQGVLLQLTDTYTITEIEIFASNNDNIYSAPFGLKFSIQEPDSSGLPTPNTALFTTTTDIPDTSSDARWLSSGTVDWELSSGDYWVTFKPENSGSNLGFSGLIPYDIDNAQGLQTSLRSTSNGNWSIGQDNISYGIRVYGETSVVPVPAAVWLFGSGLLGLIGFTRKKKS